MILEIPLVEPLVLLGYPKDLVVELLKVVLVLQILAVEALVFSGLHPKQPSLQRFTPNFHLLPTVAFFLQILVFGIPIQGCRLPPPHCCTFQVL